MVIIFGIAQDLSTDYRLLNIARSIKASGEKVQFLINSRDNRNVTYSHRGISVREFKIPFKGRNRLIHILTKQVFMFKLVLQAYRSYGCTFWFFDEEIIPVALFSRGQFILDLHEVPYKFLEYQLSRIVLRAVEKRAKYIVHANEVRQQYMLSFVFQDDFKNRVIENYLAQEFIPIKDAKKRKNERLSVYMQGLSQEERFPVNTLKVVLQCTDWQIVLVGDITRNAHRLIDGHKNRITYHGKVDPSAIPAIMIACDCSIVFYSSAKINTDLCAPNRLYWALALGLPVLTGNNKTFIDLKNNERGILVCNTDGSDFRLISKKIEEFRDQLHHLAIKSQNQASEFIFDPKSVSSLLL